MMTNPSSNNIRNKAGVSVVGDSKIKTRNSDNFAGGIEATIESTENSNRTGYCSSGGISDKNSGGGDSGHVVISGNDSDGSTSAGDTDCNIIGEASSSDGIDSNGSDVGTGGDSKNIISNCVNMNNSSGSAGSVRLFVVLLYQFCW